MPRYQDEWVINKSLFDYTTGGSCACCTFPATLFNPDGIKGLINSVSDLESDVMDYELNDVDSNTSPWPLEMRDLIWADRVKVRYKMKKEMDEYNDFFRTVSLSRTTDAVSSVPDDGNGDDAVDDERHLVEWCMNELGTTALKRIFQMPRKEVTYILSDKYGICPAYGTVMCAVVQQVANFNLTKYELDGRGKEEIEFEQMLTFHRRGGFMINVCKEGSSIIGDERDKQQREEIIDQDALYKFVRLMKSLGGPKLLQKGHSLSSTSNKANDSDDDDIDVKDRKPSNGPSFSSDRRIVRLVIAKYWADQIISKYKKANNDKN